MFWIFINITLAISSVYLQYYLLNKIRNKYSKIKNFKFLEYTDEILDENDYRDIKKILQKSKDIDIDIEKQYNKLKENIILNKTNARFIDILLKDY